MPALAFAAGVFFGFHMNPVKFIILSSVCGAVMFLLPRRHAVTRALKFGRCPFSDYGKHRRIEKLLLLALLFFLAGGAGFYIQAEKNEWTRLFEPGQTEIEGIVCSAAKKGEGRYQFVVKTFKGKTKVLVNVYEDADFGGIVENYGDMAGRRVKVEGKIELPAERRNPKTFDYRLYLRTKGIHAVMSVRPDDMTVVGTVYDKFANAVSNIGCGFSQKTAETMGLRSAGILVGMLFGDKNMLDDDVYEMFQKNGTAHILAVSGIHVGIIYLLLGRLLNARRNLFLNIVLLLFLFMYAAMASFSPSILRAGGMIALHILSKLLCMRYDMLCAGAGIALAMMIINPLVLFDVGFELSFLAIFILAITLHAAVRIHKSGITAIVALQLGMAPVTAYMFNYVSLSAFFINAPVIFIAGIIVPAGMALVPLSYMPGPVFSVPAGLVGGLCEIIYRLNEFTYVQAGLFRNVASPPLWAVVAFYGLLFFVCSETAWVFLKRKETKKLAAAVFAVIAVALAAGLPFQDDFHRAQLVFVDVGQGDCLHIRTPGGKNILVDGGGSHNFDVGKKVLMPYLLKNGVSKIDIAFVSHRHLDHYGGIASLAKNFNVAKICLYEANKAIEAEVLNETGLQKWQVVYLVKGQRIMVGKGVWIEILYPGKKTESEYGELTGDGAAPNEPAPSSANGVSAMH